MDDPKHIATPWPAIILFLVSAASFWILDTQAVWVGDDLGYMFTDSVLHNGDGHKVTSLSDILTTQVSHWKTCNGRFIIHSLVMYFVSLAPAGLYVIVNSCIFGLMVLLFYRLVLPGRPVRFLPAAICTLLLWLCVPRPGVTMLSLASYSINYMWTGCAVLGFLLLFLNTCGRPRHYVISLILLAALSLLIGALQESYSLPVSAGLLTYWLINRKSVTRTQIAMIIAFWVGSILVFFAPGNLTHATMGGGFSQAGLIAKNTALAHDIAFSSISLVATVIIILAIAIPSQCAIFCRRNILFIASILFCILLGTVSYTAIRQLFAPSLFAAILLGRLIFSVDMSRFPKMSTSMISVGLSFCYIGMIAGAYYIRLYPQEAIQSVIDQVKQGKTMIIVPENKDHESRLFHFLFDRFNDDPTTNRDLKLLFDGYTKKGLARLYGDDSNSSGNLSIMPMPTDRIVDIIQNPDTTYADGAIRTTPLSDYYSVAVFPLNEHGNIRYSVSAKGARISYERFHYGQSMYYIVPSNIETLIVK